MSDANEFLKAINILTNENNKDRVYKTTMEKEIERLLKENKEKNKIIEKQRKHIEAFKQKGNRYIEINEKDRIIIYDTKENKFSWRTLWSDLPSNIIDDLYKNELINYYKTNVLKVVRRKEKLTGGGDWYERNFYSSNAHNSGFWADLNTEFSIPLLKQVQKVRGEFRNIANKNYIRAHPSFNIDNYLITDNCDDRCIGYTKYGERCKCRGSNNISIHFNKEYTGLWLYLKVYKNLPDMYICGRHNKTATKDFTELMVWISTFLEIHYGIILENEKECMIKKLFSDLSYNEWNNINIQ